MGARTDMKPCTECLEQFGKPVCTHAGCCIFEDVPGMSAKQALKGIQLSKT
ncbi:MAG: hypothetical protein ACETVY_05535 [Candidatus Bathyarchaeia archaeon]